MGPGGYRSVFLKLPEAAKIGRATVHPQGLPLAAGEYEIRFTFPPTPGRVSIFVQTAAP